MFWERFLAECEKIGKKPNPVAKELGISSGTVTGWKNGSIPNSRALELLSKYFDCSVDYLLGRPEQKKEAPLEAGLEVFTTEELELVADYRDLSAESQHCVDYMIRMLLAAEAANQNQAGEKQYYSAKDTSAG